jgi:hypothetical protein
LVIIVEETRGGWWLGRCLVGKEAPRHSGAERGRRTAAGRWVRRSSQREKAGGGGGQLQRWSGRKP